ncbi:MAG: arginine--tRNA ligase [Candidatus Omnitrophota bacterium]|nr:arginine--tRNA ligase [Candidatus Omnitrophota bacterium]
MFAHLRQQLNSIIGQALRGLYKDTPLSVILIDFPADKQHGEFSCNIAMQLSRVLKKNPMTIAREILPALQTELLASAIAPYIEKMEVKAPGFINFYVSLKGFCAVIEDVFARQERFGISEHGQGQKFCLEFVSANPTGPLTVAHGRQAAVGDSLVNILKAVGFDAQKEYYVNDEGNQINILGRSIEARVRQALDADAAFPEDGYQGDYIRAMAQEFMRKQGIKTMADLDKQPAEAFRHFGVDHLMAVIRKDLEDFDVHFDIWSYQSKIAGHKAIEDVLAQLKAKEFIYESEGALWFKSTLWGDDKDRVVRKSNGEYTYLMPDIVYHKDKFSRGFKRIVDILGPDHHGYIPRIKAAAGALGKSPDDLDVIIVQLATIYRDGKPVSMSTRRGEFISLREVMDEVGKDAARFFFLMRQSNAPLEFDLELAKKESAENPVYYIQYAHARIHSIIRKAKEESRLAPKTSGSSGLNAAEEIDLMRKIGSYPEILVTCAKQLEPFGLVRYLQELAGCFHKFYDACRVLDDDPNVTRERLALIEGARIVLANGLRLLGVRAPEKM